MYKMPQTNIKLANERAKKLGYTVKPSTNKKKKLDVFKDGIKVATIGDIRYEDYLVHKDEKRRQLYHQRHGEYPVGTAGWLAARILW